LGHPEAPLGEGGVERLWHGRVQRRRLHALDGVDVPQIAVGELVQTLDDNVALQVRVHPPRIADPSRQDVDHEGLLARRADIDLLLRPGGVRQAKRGQSSRGDE
jgi:hypothetical protein